MRSIGRAALALALIAVLGTALADPSAASAPKLTATAVFDKASYVSGDVVSVTFSVHNSGSSAVSGITAQDDSSSPDELVLDQAGFGAFGDGVTIAAGATVTATLSGHLATPGATKVTFAGDVFDHRGFGVANVSVSAPVTVQTATASGLVFGDANANGHADAGEGVSGAKLTFSYEFGDKSYAVTTGAGGHFSLALPAAAYYLTGAGSGWVVVPQLLTIPAGGADLSLRAVRPLGDVLKAELHFTKDTYAPGDTVHVVVTLINTGSSTLRGIGAECAHAGDPAELRNAGAGWGDLAVGAPGVVLLAHQARTFDVSDTVPAAAQREGEVFVACDFGYPGVDEGRRPTASDTARVPGLSGAMDGVVQYFPHGHGGAPVGLAGVRVVLVDASTCPLVSRTVTTNSNGKFHIASAPAGSSYQLYLYPPAGWKAASPDPTHAMILGRDTVHLSFEVVRGSATVPAAPTACESGTPSPTGPGTPLANTGAAPSGLAVAGLAAVLAGLLLTVSTRRRRAH